MDHKEAKNNWPGRSAKIIRLLFGRFCANPPPHKQALRGAEGPEGAIPRCISPTTASAPSGEAGPGLRSQRERGPTTLRSDLATSRLVRPAQDES